MHINCVVLKLLQSTRFRAASLYLSVELSSVTNNNSILCGVQKMHINPMVYLQIVSPVIASNMESL